MEEDAKLAHQLTVGCTHAMERVIELYGGRLRQTIGQLTAWCPDVDDLLQETLVRAWKNAKNYRGDGPLDKWLVSIAFRVCLDHQRGLRRLVNRLKRLRLNSVHVQHRNGVAIQATETQKWDQMQQAMKQLSAADRQLLVMKYLEDWSMEELAGQLNQSVETVHVRLHRAKNRLRKLVNANEQQ